MDSPDPPSRPLRRSRSSELEERPGHGSDPRFLCPTGPKPPRSSKNLREVREGKGQGEDETEGRTR
jgi:hypothetical protein